MRTHAQHGAQSRAESVRDVLVLFSFRSRLIVGKSLKKEMRRLGADDAQLHQLDAAMEDETGAPGLGRKALNWVAASGRNLSATV
jgi:hypothetical protein